MIGEKIDNWIIERRLGMGSQGQVLLVREEGTQRRAALKLLTEGPGEQAGLAARLKQAMPILQKLKHENLVRFLGAGEFKGHPYYLMEYVDGPSVAFLLEERGPLPWRQVVEIGLQVCRGLHHAYLQDIVHRDLKPANLLCSPEGVVKVAECGIRRSFGETSFSEDGTLLGTADYLAPEQADKKPPTRQSDLYSLGVVLYQLLTGRLPFLAETESQMLHQHRQGRVEPPSKRVQGVPAELEQLILELLAKEPENRPASAALVENRLLSIRTNAHQDDEDEDAPIPRSSAHATGRRPSPHLRAESASEEGVPWTRVAVFGVLLILVVAVLTWGLWPASPETVLQEVQTLMDQEAWNDADTKLNRFASKLDVPPYKEQATALRVKIKQAMLTKSNARNMSTIGFTPPASEAERLFRQGIIEYYLGQPEKAKQTWHHLMVAFHGLPAHAAWVQQARLALEAANKHRPHYQELTDALTLAEKEKPEEARRRLESLRALYAAIPASDPKLKELLDKVEQRLQTLPK